MACKRVKELIEEDKKSDLDSDISSRMSSSDSTKSTRRISATKSQNGSLKSFQKNVVSNYKNNVNKTCSYKDLRQLNPHLQNMEEDILYHITLGNKTHDLQKMFGDVKFIVMGGTPKRMEQFAYFIMDEIGYELPPGTILNDISRHSHRYAMFKVGPVLSVSHGMGMPSIGILLHELIKLVHHTGIKDPIFFRIGTCGGFAKKGGTVVVSDEVVNDYMESIYRLPILGAEVDFPALLNQNLIQEIMSLAAPEDNFETIRGKTYCTDSFYEGSGRADGAICEFSVSEGRAYYEELKNNGVVNVEMESLAFAALTCRAGIKSAVICVILSDRLETDKIKQKKEVLDEWQTRPQKLLARYIKRSLSITQSEFSKTPKVETKATSSALPAPTTDYKACSPTCSSYTYPTEKSFGQTKAESRSTWTDCYKTCELPSKNDHDSTPQSDDIRASEDYKDPARKTSGTEKSGIWWDCCPKSSWLKATAKSDDTESTPKSAFKASDFDSSSKSQMSDESKRSFYRHCIKMPTCDTTPAPAFQTDIETPIQTVKGWSAQPGEERPCCLGRSEDVRSQKTYTDQHHYFEERQAQEQDTGKTVGSTPDSDAASSTVSSRIRGTNAVQVDNPDLLGPCCTENYVQQSPKPVPFSDVGPCCTGRTKDTPSPPECTDSTKPSEKRSDKKEEPQPERGSDERTIDSAKSLVCPITIDPAKCNLRAYAEDDLTGKRASNAVVFSPETSNVNKTLGSTFITSSPMSFGMASKSSNGRFDCCASINVTPLPVQIETPDTPVCKTNYIQAFITPTPVVTKSSNGSCCMKFPMKEFGKEIASCRSSVTQVNKHDESPSPCAACKKYQESKNQEVSPAEIIKCPHKLKRLKDECEGYE